MQNLILQDFPEIVERRVRRFPGGIAKVSKAMGISRACLYDKLRCRTQFTVKDLKALDTILHFSEEEKQLIWR